MGGAVSSGSDNNELVDNLMHGKYIRSEKVEQVFRALDRAAYMTPESFNHAYKDLAWRSGPLHLSSPCIYSEVMEGLELSEGLSFLNIGSGTGYLSSLVGLILGSQGINHGVEVHPEVYEYALTKLTLLLENSPVVDDFDFCQPKFFNGNGLCLASLKCGYDRVYCGASCPTEYEAYFKNLIKVGGILVMPYNDTLVQVRRVSKGKWVSRSLLSVTFAPLRVPRNEEASKLLKLDDQCPPRLEVLARGVVREALRGGVMWRHPELRERTRRPPPRARPACPRRICIPVEPPAAVEGLNVLHDLDAENGADEMNALLSLVISMGHNRVAGALRFDRLESGTDSDEGRDDDEPRPRSGGAGSGAERSDSESESDGDDYDSDTDSKRPTRRSTRRNSRPRDSVAHGTRQRRDTNKRNRERNQKRTGRDTKTKKRDQPRRCQKPGLSSKTLREGEYHLHNVFPLEMRVNPRRRETSETRETSKTREASETRETSKTREASENRETGETRENRETGGTRETRSMRKKTAEAREQSRKACETEASTPSTSGSSDARAASSQKLSKRKSKDRNSSKKGKGFSTGSSNEDSPPDVAGGTNRRSGMEWEENKTEDAEGSDEDTEGQKSKAKRQKLDSGIGESTPGSSSPARWAWSESNSDDYTDIEDDDEEEEETACPKATAGRRHAGEVDARCARVSELMRRGVLQLPLPPALNRFVNLDRNNEE